MSLKSCLAIVLSFYTFFTPFYTWASTSSDFFEVDTITIQEMPQAKDTAFKSLEELPYAATDAVSENSSEEEIIRVIDQLLVVGEKLVKLVDKGRPVVDFQQLTPISVLPVNSDLLSYGVNAPLLLSDWKVKKSPVYQLIFKNKFGMSLVTFTYYFIYQYNGKYAGRGAYLAGLQIIPQKIDVFWGIDFSAQAELVSVGNRGSEANPIAGAVLKLSFKNKTIVQELQGAMSFSITGRGQITKM